MFEKKYSVKIETPIIAPYKHTRYIPFVRKILEQKYNSKHKHIDKAFDRWEIEGEVYGIIYGNTVYGAIKRALHIAGSQLNDSISVKCMCIPENIIVLYTFSIILRNGEQTLINTEIATRGQATIIGDLRAIENLLPLRIQIGGKRKHGFGYVTIEKPLR